MAEQIFTFLMLWQPFIKKYWFLIGLFLVILVSYLWPLAGSKKSAIQTEYTIGYGVTCFIFLLSGLSLQTKVLTQAFTHWKLILMVQCISFGFTPVIGYVVYRLLLIGFDSTLAKGVVICCSTPTTIASNVLMTKQAGGNDASALVNAVVGNTLGIFISPLLILGYLGTSNVSVQFGPMFLKLGVTVLVPLIVGQVIRYFFLPFVEQLQKSVNFGYLNSTLLLILIWGVFCDTFLNGVFSVIPAWQTVVVLLVVIALFCMFSFACFIASKYFFKKKDVIAIVMCGATKTVALGIPLINVIFASDPAAGVLSLPLLMYHAMQLILGSFLVTWFVHWVNLDVPVDADGEGSSEALTLEIIE